MSNLFVDTIEPEGATTVLTLGSATDTIKIPGGGAGADKVLTSDATGGAAWAAAAAGGKVLQVLQHELATSINTTSTSYVASGLSVTITAATTASRFILQCTGGQSYTTVAGNYNTMTFYVGGAEVSPNGPYEVIAQCNSVSPPMQSPHSMLMIHSPASVSAQTYTVYYKCNSGTGHFNEAASRVQLTVTELSS